MSAARSLLTRAEDGERLSDAECVALAECDDLDALMRVAATLRDRGHGGIISYSRKVFIPLTKLCRDSCHYCTFAHPPVRGERCYLAPDEVLAIARAGQAGGCHEALFTLGDKPEQRYRAAQRELAELGHDTTISYLVAMAELVGKETTLLPHLNCGVANAAEMAAMRHVSVSQGLMLETSAERLSKRGGPHFGSPDKAPEVRLAMIQSAGDLAIPFTSGILIGIGETRAERIAALLRLRDLHERSEHLQEIIIQNFRAKSGTRMAAHPEPDMADHLWSIAVARIILGPDINIQAPPNLARGALSRIIGAGINDWGGVSPVTCDHVNPERPWPALDRLARATASAGKTLVARLALYPAYVRHAERWLDPQLRKNVLRTSDADGFARTDPWTPGAQTAPPDEPRVGAKASSLASLLDRAVAGKDLGIDGIVTLFGTRGGEFHEVCAAADALRADRCGSRVSYVVTRNINYTNICIYRCRFCAFSKGRTSDTLRGRPYDLPLHEIQRRALEAWDRGAVEVCLQGGIHPDYDGNTYLSILQAIKSVCPDIHVHAFSPLEVWQGAATLSLPVREFLVLLKESGLGSLPGTAAEILDDEVRAEICPDKLSTAQWLSVVETAHSIGLRTTATIMFGHVDRAYHWARHLLRVRGLQARTGGFTEFVPLPFVPMEAPLHLHGRSRLGPTYREAVLMHAVARLVLHPHISNIQTSWVKMGPEGARACLRAGANDLGGTLMNESITRAAGAAHGQEFAPERMAELILSIGRAPRQRTTLYGTPNTERIAASFNALPLTPFIESNVRRSRWSTPAAVQH
jgi:FO synthase